MKTFACFETDRASHHLATLGHHFERKVEVIFEAEQCRVQFPFGQCEMTAHEAGLDLIASADDQLHLDLVVQTVTNHVERFAFRENPILEWQVPTT